jgi:large subunit ribosomal protein L5
MSDEAKKETRQNPMREVLIGKVTINLGVGESGERLNKLERVLGELVGQKSVRTLSTHNNRDFGIRKGMPIGCKVTLRNERAEKFLKDALWVVDNQIEERSFDENGNISFGITDYTEFPGVKYDPEIGIFGMDCCITMERRGYRVMRRVRAKAKMGKNHRVSKEEAIEFLRSKYDVEVI